MRTSRSQFASLVAWAVMLSSDLVPKCSRAPYAATDEGVALCVAMQAGLAGRRDGGHNMTFEKSRRQIEAARDRAADRVAAVRSVEVVRRGFAVTWWALFDPATPRAALSGLAGDGVTARFSRNYTLAAEDPVVAAGLGCGAGPNASRSRRLALQQWCDAEICGLLRSPQRRSRRWAVPGVSTHMPAATRLASDADASRLGPHLSASHH